jgi:hypothetical protein
LSPRRGAKRIVVVCAGALRDHRRIKIRLSTEVSVLGLEFRVGIGSQGCAQKQKECVHTQTSRAGWGGQVCRAPARARPASGGAECAIFHGEGQDRHTPQGFNFQSPGFAALAANPGSKPADGRTLKEFHLLINLLSRTGGTLSEFGFNSGCNPGFPGGAVEPWALAVKPLWGFCASKSHISQTGQIS